MKKKEEQPKPKPMDKFKPRRVESKKRTFGKSKEK
jgi:hypothetical protein